ncbi:MAG: 5-formyltetrahydrofolate cyclo-ligase [Ectothiorhodospiraceae bacterium AqS1]|nr:5-formyltetrahydrofolate cyclo-ligase [Ectothiorhodospiraceae bacterium AqS1]
MADGLASSGALADAAKRSERALLRRDLRRRRRGLAEALRLRASKALARRIAKSPWFVRSRRIAAYLPSDGEIDLRPLIDIARKRGKRVYLPLMHRRSLRFLPFDAHTRLLPNRFAILEPRLPISRAVHPLFLDLALLPAVAFDAQGNRLGRGGGYYDRRFAARRRHRFLRGPKLVGTGYAFQQVASLNCAPWDIPLDAIASEAFFRPTHRSDRCDSP